MSFPTLQYENDIDFHEIEKIVKREWDQKHSTEGVFKYKLSIEKEKVLDGEYGFLLQVSQFYLSNST